MLSVLGHKPPFWSRSALLVTGAFALLPAPAAAESHGVATVRDLWPALSRCWSPPPHSAGMEVTVRFSIKRTGELIGDLQVTYSKLSGDADVQQRFRDSVLAAVRDCTPLQLSDRFGATIAGQPLSVRFIAPADGQSPPRANPGAIPA